MLQKIFVMDLNHTMDGQALCILKKKKGSACQIRVSAPGLSICEC